MRLIFSILDIFINFANRMTEFEVIHIDETDSTNRWLREHASDGNVAVVADYQTAGRGCGANGWESERGKNLLFSVLIHPGWVRAGEQFFLSMAVSNAIRRTLDCCLLPRSEVKWPNDIYVGDGKMCGILIENELRGNCIKDCIVGIGVNVNQRLFRSDAPNPVSMVQVAGGSEFDREHVLNRVLQEFADILDHWDPAVIGREYRQHLYRRNGFHAYTDSAGTFMAEMVGVEDDGHLVLCDESGLHRCYAFKEVQFVP